MIDGHSLETFADTMYSGHILFTGLAGEHVKMDAVFYGPQFACVGGGAEMQWKIMHHLESAYLVNGDTKKAR